MNETTEIDEEENWPSSRLQVLRERRIQQEILLKSHGLAESDYDSLDREIDLLDAEIEFLEAQRG